jgi:hypothetical protein
MHESTLQLIEIRINDDLTLVQMPDPAKFNVHLKGDHHYFVHFLNPKVVGTEFARLHKGDNIFKMTPNETTDAYFFDVTQIESWQTEQMMASTKPSPCTGPIIIPPRWIPEGS